jgi:hypothetical protein
MAIAGFFNPAITLFGSIIKFITSNSKNAVLSLAIDLTGMMLPGGLLKDIAVGVVSDIVETTSYERSVKKIIPYNNIILQCYHCGKYTHYYASIKDKITCTKCSQEQLIENNKDVNKIYLFPEHIKHFHTKIYEGKIYEGNIYEGKEY